MSRFPFANERKKQRWKGQGSFFSRNHQAFGLFGLLLGIFIFSFGFRSFRLFPGQMSLALKEATGIALALFILICGLLTMLKGFPLKHPGIFEVVVSAATAWLLAVGGLLSANGLMDNAVERSHRVSVLKAEHSDTGKSHGYLIVTSWRKSGETETISASSKAPCVLMTKLFKDDVVEVKTKPGRFGYEWLVGISIPDRELKKNTRLKQG